MADFFSSLLNSQLPPEFQNQEEQNSDSGFRFYENTPDKQLETEEESEITQEERDKLKSYIFSTPQTFQYPFNVGENEEQPHSVRFYINARSNSRVVAATNQNTLNAINFYGGITEDAGLKPVDTTAENRRTADENKTISTGAGVVAGFVLGKKLAGKNWSGAAQTGAGLIGALGGGIAAGVAVETTSKLRTLGVIELYVSAPPVAQYSANWENKELGALAGATDFFKDGFSMDALLSAGKGVGELTIRSAIRAAANLPGELGITGELGASIDLASGKVNNPYKEQLFSNMGFRQFAFNYKFNPRNKTEYQNVQRIIQLFKYHMHPEISPSKMFLEYPSEFNIEYHYKGTQNTNVSKISSCALTDVKITYGNQDAFTTIRDMNGAPAEINMQLAFTELETLTNDRIADGY